MSTLQETPPLSYEEDRGKPMPSLNHARAQTRLIIEFSRITDYEVFSEHTIELNGERFTPDLCIYPRRPANWENDTIRSTTPPLMAVEIFSPQQGYQDVMDHVRAYLASGVKSCWVVVPPLRTVTIYLPGEPPKTTDTGVVVDPVTGVSANLAVVFA